jgi:hypothetical protein
MLKGRSFITLFIFAALLVYVIIRAYALSFTHDESISYTIVQGKEIFENTANNHQLNTVLMSFSKSLFGSSEFSLRLPNTLSFVLYLLGCFLIFKRSKRYWLFLFGISIAVLNPFLIEFFSLARGYGLSLAFMVMSLVFLFKDVNEYLRPEKFFKDFIFASLFASLAIYANLSMINFFIGLLITYSFKYWSYRKKQDLKVNFDLKFLATLLVSCIPLSLAVVRLLVLKEANQLYFGASSFLDGFNALILSSIYITLDSSWVNLIIGIIVITFLFIGVFSIILKKKYSGPLFLSITLIFILVLGLFLEHFLFDAKFPMGRTALYYILLFAVFVYHLFEFLITEFNVKKQYFIPVVLSLIAPIMINFANGVNYSHTRTWMFEAHTKDVMKTIKNHTENADQNFTVSNHWLFEPTINYYISTWNLKLDPTNREGVNLNSDFIYQFEVQSTFDGYKVLNSYGDIHSILFVKSETKKK